VETTHSFRSSRATTRFALNRMESTDAPEFSTSATCGAKGCSARHSAVGQNDSIQSWKMRMSNLSTFRHRSVNIISVSFVIRAYPLTINSECLPMSSLK